MIRVVRSFGFALALALGVGVVVAPGLASAQYREFTGRVDRITDSRVYLDNRQGDKLSFTKIPETEVSGEKTSWGDIKKKDWLTVSWKFIDRPRKAYKVLVLPPREDDD